MKTFLQEVAESIYKKHSRVEEVTVVFPNRRAALYFRKHAGHLLNRPVFSPKLLTIEDFFSDFSELHVPDRLVLISILYRVYQDVYAQSGGESAGGFEEFYFWGDMLLRDFDEADKYLVRADQLFKDLSQQKELDASFDFLTDEQRQFLKNFWGQFDTVQSKNKNRFLYLWRRLGTVYHTFHQVLSEQGYAYEGMLHRRVVEGLPDSVASKGDGPVYFAGFNALTTAEEKLISYFVEHRNAGILWDIDEWYLNNEIREAGQFFRMYQKHPVLGRTFLPDTPANFQTKISTGNPIRLYGAAQPVAQAKLMAQVLRDQLENGINPEETLIVLSDESLLMPVLHGVSGAVEKLNVTMGFPLTSTSMFNFVELLVELQLGQKEGTFNHRQVTALLDHPYVVASDPAVSRSKRKDIVKSNWVHVPATYLASGVPLHREIFRPVGGSKITEELLAYLKDAVRAVGGISDLSDLDKEYALHFIKHFNLLETIVVSEHPLPAQDANNSQSIKKFLRLFRQLMRSQKIPFSGEPLKGLQIMGVLETRSLDFKNVFVLSLNEGSFPANASKGSYIPYNIRRAYGLPTLEHQDAIYAYLFYRVLQRAENVFLFYNSETDVLGQGEMSRYLQQLIYESGLQIKKHVLHNPVRPESIAALKVQKNEEVLEELSRLSRADNRSKGFSPTALNSYLECRLQFYFRYVAHIREADEVEEDLDARVLGTFLHEVMEHFYKGLLHRKKTSHIEQEDLEGAEEVIDGLIDQTFTERYRLDPEKPVIYAGQRLVVREVVRRFAAQILRMDRNYAPFVIEGLEQEGILHTLTIDRAPFKVTLSGKIDRVDRKNDVLRVIDYKTGKDELDFGSLDALFLRDGKRNKAAFQTLLYAWLYMRSAGRTLEGKVRVVPGLINRINAFDEDFSFGLRLGRHHVTDVSEMFPVFEEKLRELFMEMFDPDIAFDQTPHTDACRICAYNRICYR